MWDYVDLRSLEYIGITNAFEKFQLKNVTAPFETFLVLSDVVTNSYKPHRLAFSPNTLSYLKSSLPELNKFDFYQGDQPKDISISGFSQLLGDSGKGSYFESICNREKGLF